MENVIYLHSKLQEFESNYLSFDLFLKSGSYGNEKRTAFILFYRYQIRFRKSTPKNMSQRREKSRKEWCHYKQPIILKARNQETWLLQKCDAYFAIQSTPDNSNPRYLESLANSNQNRFALDFLHTFTVILPSVTRTLDNSNLIPLTRSNFCFPSDHFYTILPAITRTMFLALKKSGKSSVLMSETLNFEFSIDVLQGKRSGPFILRPK